MAQAKAKLKYARISTQKTRLVVDQIRGKSIEEALEVLKFSNKKAAKIVKKVLDSAISNAEHNEQADIDMLRVEEIYVDEGPVLKRWRPRAMGRVGPINKPTSHITIKVSEQQ